MADSPAEVLDLRWRNGQEFAHLYLDLRSWEHLLELSRDGRTERFAFFSQTAA
jgi:hypothetical protein